MNLTLEQAKLVLLEYLRGIWAGPGELMIAPLAQEDARGFALTAGAKEYFVDDNSEFARVDDTFYFVSKSDGVVTQDSFMDAPAQIRLSAMAYVGEVPPELL